MARRLSRRHVLAGATALAGASSFPMPSIAQNAPLKIGILTVKTGPLAAGGIHCEEGITTFLRDRNMTLAGRKIDMVVADSGGNPAGAKTKAVELVERDKVSMIMGPFAAFEHLAIVDYLAQNKMPTFGYAGAEDITQRTGTRCNRSSPRQPGAGRSSRCSCGRSWSTRCSVSSAPRPTPTSATCTAKEPWTRACSGSSAPC